ncbi:DNA-binding transcription factor ACE2 [Saccharomyces paradoxus]|uniref:DNA-binding transcription factor ACE2 n=1 Tax=Saccharomyces paradoxus TaxID=27291 RepID=A0A8B8UVV4_SACPA|nr:Ace2 [Saccharomyces paradoxus]QHS74868.1 Ace2 [Saccharomyces paradoxus]
MDNVVDPWYINPSGFAKDIQDEEYAQHHDNVDPTIPQADNYPSNNENDDGLDNLLGMDYYNIDDLLTQELRDLDIPLVPSPKTGDDPRDKKSIDRTWNFGDENNKISHYSKKSMSSHKRGLSGTAIFGFLGHNKTLSVSSLQQSILNMSKDPQPMDLINELGNHTVKHNNHDFDHIREKDGENSYLSQVLLKQQEELRIALEKQKEVNEKLEKQLRDNQLQQEKLRRVLEEQEEVAQKLVSETAKSNSKPGSPVILKTPAMQNSRSKDNAIIVTTNSANGGYQFPPPTLISPPISNTSINGSPSRKYHRQRYPNKSPESNGLNLFSSNSGYLRDSELLSFSPPNYNLSMCGLAYDDHNNTSDKNDNDKRNNTGDNIFRLFEKTSPGGLSISPRINGNSLRSPFLVNADRSKDDRYATSTFTSRTQLSPIHKKRESVVSTVSTISQLQDDIEPIHMRNTQSPMVKNGNALPSSSVLPPIPGSTNNTPIKNSLPQKHLFQHTPIKTLTKDGNSLDPLLNAPDLTDRQLEIKTPIRSNSHGEEESYPQAPPVTHDIHKSPTLDITSPPPGEIIPRTTPMKITKKPTTLPPGTIDQYVKELPDKLFECLYPNCSKVFKRRYNIRSHIQTHLQDRPYSCDFPGCTKAFVRNHDLIRHKISHNAKKYICPCGKRFNREDALMVHRSRMICTGGKKLEHSISKKLTSPKKSHLDSPYETSPVKETIARDKDGSVLMKMEEQLRDDMRKHGLLDPPPSRATYEQNSSLTPSNESDSL